MVILSTRSQAPSTFPLLHCGPRPAYFENKKYNKHKSSNGELHKFSPNFAAMKVYASNFHRRTAFITFVVLR